MQPYNECENRWLSSTRKNLKKHWREYEPVYAGLVGIMLIALLVLGVLTGIDSFYEIGN
jgi:hypothetical protein